MDPGPLTLRQLLTRAMAVQRDRWNHTATIVAELLNGPRPRRDKRPWRSADVHPLQHRPVAQPVEAKEFMQTLRALWM